MVTDKLMKKILAFAFLSIVVMSFLSANETVKEEKQWRQFAKDNHCRLTGEIEGTSSSGFTSNGDIAWFSEPGKDIYTCDNGYTVTRER